MLYSHRLVATANGLAVRSDADFLSNDPAKSPVQSRLAGHLQQIWDSTSPGFDAGFARLATIADNRTYAKTLDTLSGQEIAAVASGRYEASQNFARDAFRCPAFTDSKAIRAEAGCTWMQATGTWATHDASGGFPAHKWRTGTFVIGGQTELRPDLILAGSLGYETSRMVNGSSLARATSDTGLALLALRYQTGPWTIDGALDIAHGSVDMNRRIPLAGAAAKASTSTFNGGIHLRTAYTVPVGNFYAEPALYLDANYIRIGGYHESGAAPFNLRISPLEDIVLGATPEIRIGSHIDLGSGTRADIHAGAGVSFLHGNNFEADARFATSPRGTGNFRGVFQNDTIVGRFSAGVAIQTASGFDFGLQYQGRHSANQTAHGGQLRASYRF